MKTIKSELPSGAGRMPGAPREKKEKKMRERKREIRKGKKERKQGRKRKKEWKRKNKGVRMEGFK